MSYKHNKAWRLRNTAKRNAQRKKYYKKFPGPPGRRRWSIIDADFILTSKLCDRSIRSLIGRSVQAIQNKRCELNKEDKVR